ncbi:hypothetical protein DPMN_113119 [Dreissena polymorpha]|uniref:Uncharacterized protein n=1 Tax=Dreissena polymorpha TaxID=45954 RepID=A0A9D4QQD8_DREPO|nr:hypothetical protein DPMN_113119 [Dreissena polymorpha]
MKKNKGNGETDNYNSIDITEEPYGNGNYDHTTVTLSSEAVTRKPDNIYNKLKIDRPGDYDHLGRLEHIMSQAGNDYNTSAISQRNEVVGDYNHITNPVRTTVTRGEGTKDHEQGDYDVLNGITVKLPPGDAHDYAHAKI